MPRYPIYPIRLRPADKSVLHAMTDLYNLEAMSDTVRVSVRVLHELGLTPEKVIKLNKAFEAKFPDALKISINPTSSLN